MDLDWGLVPRTKVTRTMSSLAEFGLEIVLLGRRLLGEFPGCGLLRLTGVAACPPLP